MTVVVTVWNTPDTFNNSAAGSFSETGIAAVNNANGRHARYRLCDFRNVGYWCCGVVFAVNVHRMNFVLANHIS